VTQERDVLISLNHPFILELLSTYQDKNTLYMLFELVQGGELFNYMQLQDDYTVPLHQARFYGACVLDALQYAHSRDVLYRDLKPENLMIDKEGYIRIVDFGFAKVVQDQTFTVLGTPEYLAPEIVLGKGYGKTVDYWAMGVLIFEMLAGHSAFVNPYQDTPQMQIFKNIVGGKFSIPYDMDHAAGECVKGLLKRNVLKRLGGSYSGADEIKAAAFFTPIDFRELYLKRLHPPFKPTIEGFIDASSFEDFDDGGDDAVYYGDQSHFADFSS